MNEGQELIGYREMDEAQECIDRLLAGPGSDVERVVLENRWAHHVEAGAEALPHEAMAWYWWQLYVWTSQVPGQTWSPTAGWPLGGRGTCVPDVAEPSVSHGTAGSPADVV